ncbi:acyl-CoA N-acyltransferase [Cyathus striatus]|nr:acyl-CoA N-acyltransferase [Cyathus striatus]
MSDSDPIIFDLLATDDLQSALEIELQGFPPDEAATIDSFRLRQSQAGDLFLGAYIPGSTKRELIGYICSTLSNANTLSHESMSTHIPSGSSVCIHSVCVAPQYRHKGVASLLLNEYASRLQKAHQAGAPYERLLLITHDDLIPLYEKAGFTMLGRSSVVHGSKPWFEMRRNLSASVPAIPNQDISGLPPAQVGSDGMPPGLWEALKSSTRNRQSGRLIHSFENGIAGVLTDNTGGSENKFDLLCPRDGCGSLILKAGVAKWVERASVQMDPTNHPPSPLLPALPAPPETTQWWLITPSPMEFENIGFSRAVPSIDPSKPTLKLLACAECDLGPLGWCEPGGSEFWLACSRVAYRE